MRGWSRRPTKVTSTVAIYDGIEGVSGDQKLPFLTPGQYRVSLQSIIEGVSKFDQAPFLKAVFTVVEASGQNATAVGTTATHVIKKGKFNYYLRDIKALVSAILNEPQDKIDGKITGELLSEAGNNDARGTEFRVEVTLESKKDGTGSYPKTRFFPVESAQSSPPPADAKAAAKKSSARAA